jgi:uncharacterized repeat protein (TIGR01451 family)
MRTNRLRRLTTAIISGLAIAVVSTLTMMLGGGMSVVFAEDQPDGSTITPTQNTDGTWGPGTITATADVVIQPGVVITIASNTTILVADGVGITVNGDLHSNGPVTFTGISTTPGVWEGITYADGSSGYLNQTSIEYAIHALTLDTLNPISITNSVLRHNRHATTTDNDAYGAGLTIMRGDHTIDHTDIHHNSVETTYNGADVYGGGVDIQGGNSRILYSHIYENSASTSTSASNSYGGGGGILIRAGNPLIQYCEIMSNTLYTRRQDGTYPGAGAGIGVYGNTGAEIRNNWIINNVNTSQAAAGGGIGFQRYVSANIIDSNIISGNAALHSGLAGEGGGIDDWGGSTFTATNNLIYGNTTNGQGGGIATWGENNARVLNNTFVGNTAYQGGAIYSHRGYYYNNIVVGNTATNQGGGVYRAGGTIDYNDIYGNTAPSGADWYGTVGSNNISVDPQFLGIGDLVQQYHIRQVSPVIDVGTNSVSGLPNSDFDDQARPLDTTWDMGFDEVDPFTYAKLVDRETVSGGLPLVYTIVITNPDPHATLIGAQVADVLPANTSYSAGPNCNLGSCTYDSGINTITWAGDVPAGMVLALDYTVLVNVGLAEDTEITNQADVSVGTLSDTTNEVTTIFHNPDLSVTKSANPEPVEAGDVLNYSIVITNNGLGDATGVTVSDPLPANTHFVPGSIVLDPPGAGTAGTAPPTLATDVRINAGDSVEISYQVTVDVPLNAGTIIENEASVTSTQDPTPVTGSANSTVSTTPAVNVEKSGPDRANAGDTAVFTFAVTNVGNTLLHNVEVEDDYAGPGVYVSGDDGDGWLDLTETWIHTASYTIQPDDPMPLINTVVVTATDAYGTQTTDNDTHSIGLGPSSGSIFLPLIIQGGGQASDLPDLVVESLIATSDSVTITIRNQSDVDVNDAFWVDIYFDPGETPGLNQPWDTIASYGVVWGVTTSIPAGGSLTLTTGGDYYFEEYSSPTPLPVGANVYALVDSINYATGYGAVRESDENNNLFGPVTSTTGVTGGATRIGGQSQPASREGLPTR